MTDFSETLYSKNIFPTEVERMFAIVDLETTGGNPVSDRIIEIGVVLHDGNKIIGEYATLINPEREISAFISTFTGITNAMVRDAPKFEEVAAKILGLLGENIFVAHNARFDYNFLKNEFRRINIPFVRKNLCTVQLSRRILPHHKSYSLGNICRDLGIHVDNRHRAFGDAAATAVLLERLIEQDTENVIKELLEDDFSKLQLPKGINSNVIETLPEETGIFYLYNAQGEVIYIDKTKNIREQIFSLFTKKSSDKLKQQLYTEIADVSYELTGNELIASLLQTIEVKDLSPKYNRAILNVIYKYGLFAEKDTNGFQRLLVRLLEEEEHPLMKFSSKFKAEKMMHTILSNSRLEPTFKKIDNALQYNSRMQEALSKFIYPHENFFIIDIGRNGTERSVIQIENYEFRGYGFFEPGYIRHPEELKDLIRPPKIKLNHKNVIQNYLSKNTKNLEVIAY